MASAKTKTAAATGLEDKVLHIPLKDIIAAFDWNSRSGNWQEPSGDDEEHEFADLMASIKAKGQDTPVTVRPKGKKFELIVGFRRFAAISAIAKETGDKEATIKAIAKNLTDAEARSENLRENTGRADLQGPDLAFGIYDLYTQRVKEGATPTDSALAAEIGKNQSYVSKLLRIMKNTKPSITKKWRDAPMQLSVNEMDRVSKVDKDRQDEEYDSLVKGKGDAPTTGRGAWLEAAKKKAAQIATLLGNLEREELISTEGLSFSEHLDKLIKVNKEATAANRKAIAKFAEEAYQTALNTEPAAEDDAEAAE